ncbi:MAG: ABC transporter permease, partial [Aquihabitans sp.]
MLAGTTGRGSGRDVRHRASTSRAIGILDRVRTSWPLLRLLTVREYRARYRQSLLDLGWSLVSPIAILAVYGLIFSQAFDVNGEGAPYLSFVWAGLVVWTLYSTGLGM